MRANIFDVGGGHICIMTIQEPEIALLKQALQCAEDKWKGVYQEDADKIRTMADILEAALAECKHG